MSTTYQNIVVTLVKVYLYDIVYKILKLVLILPVATLGLRGFFSYNEHYKKKLRCKMVVC